MIPLKKLPGSFALRVPTFSDVEYNGLIKTKHDVFILYYSGDEYGETQGVSEQ